MGQDAATIAFMADRADVSEHHPLGRIVSFSDGVVAIGITLLILPLASIDLPSSNEPGGADALMNPIAYIWNHNQGLIVSFVISWIVILVFWLAHHRIFERLQAVNSTMILWNSLWLFAIVVLPFPTNLLGQSPFSGPGINQITGFYLATLTVLSFSLAMVVYETRKDRTLLTKKARKSEPNPTLWTLFDQPCYMAILTVAGLFIGQYAIWGLFLMFPMNSMTKQIEDYVLAKRAEKSTDPALEPVSADTKQKDPGPDVKSDPGSQ